MDIRIPITLGLTVTAAYVVRYVLAWLGNLDAECAEQPARQFFEDPSSLKKVPTPSIFMEATKSLSVVVPAYNEEDRLPPMLEEMLAYLQKRRDRDGPHFTYEVIVVDDGSTDATRQVALQFVRRFGFDAVRLLQLPRNRGKGFAVKAGVLCARGALILMADADGATVAADEKRLEESLVALTASPSQKVRDHGSAAGVAAAGGVPASLPANARLGVAVGSRAHMQQQAMSKRHWLRNFLTHAFHALVMLVVGGAVRDTQCGFKLFTRSAAGLLFSNMRLQRWCFDVELMYLAQRLDIPVSEVSVTWTEIPGSKIRFISMLHMAWELLSILSGYSILKIWAVRTPVDRHTAE